MNPRRIYKITSTLVKSELRSGRSGAFGTRLFSNPIVVFVLDVIVFAGSAVLVYLLLQAIGTLPPDMASLLNTLTVQAVTSLPSFIAPAVFIAAVLFELNVSSKFASSDVVNWLPVSQTDYVTASTLSVSYLYSFLPSLALGVTYPLAARMGLQDYWGVAAVLCLIALFAVGALVEIMRAALNRVTSVVYGKAGRGTIVIRLAITAALILAVELGFNPIVLSQVIGTFTGAINAAEFVPFFWPSASVGYLLGGQDFLAGAFFLMTVAFAGVALLVAIKVRSMYWSPMPVTIQVSTSAYAPRSGFLQSLGMSATQAAIVRKDLRGYTRRRELISYLALPVVFVALMVFQTYSTSSYSSSSTGASVYPFWLTAGILAVIVGATSVGHEGKAIMNVYASPVGARTFFRAKLLVSMLFGLTTVIAMVVITAFLEPETAFGFLASLSLSVIIVIDCTLIGIAVGARFPDLQDRPRPRFVRPAGMLIGILVGLGSGLATGWELMLWPFFGSYFESFGLTLGIVVGMEMAVGLVLTFVAYRFAVSGISELMSEIPV